MREPTPTYPMQEVHVPMDFGADPSAPIVAVQRDSANRWWLTVGGECVREATLQERLAACAGESIDAGEAVRRNTE